MRVKFPSIENSEKYGYAFDSDHWQSGTDVETTFVMFETYGDGLTAHSRDWSITRAFMADYLASLAVAMLADDELAARVSYTLTRAPSIEAIEFAASVKYKESDASWTKRRYYSVGEKKLSARPALEHDKRYTVIAEWNDGSPMAIYRMVLPEYASNLERFLYAEAVRNWVMKQPSGYMSLTAEFLGWNVVNVLGEDRDECRAVANAVETCRAVIESYQKWAQAESSLDNIRRWAERKKEAAATKAA